MNTDSNSRANLEKHIVSGASSSSQSFIPSPIALDTFSGANLGDISSQSSAMEEQLPGPTASPQVQSSSTSFFPNYVLLKNYSNLALECAPSTRSETSATPFHTSHYSNCSKTLFSAMSSTPSTEEIYHRDGKMLRSDPSISDHDHFGNNSSQSHTAGSVGMTDLDVQTHDNSEGGSPEGEAKITSGSKFSPACFHSAQGQSSNEVLIPSNDCLGNSTHSLGGPAQEVQTTSECAPKSYLDTTLNSASESFSDTLDGHHAQSDSRDQLDSTAEAINLNTYELADAETDRSDLPSSSPFLEPISAPPTSSPPIFTSSPSPSQTSTSSIPDFMLDCDSVRGSL
ncbi:hypothetical protein L218DRAFT_324917 [Marasmius fiardii PR-910]|nr:hypothetical protein L218DRAFT_324917 [Marasmius fiardii PR-910]